jgi:hypothetical protein
MKEQKMHARIFLLIALLLLTTNVYSQDPNFYIFLCFGQSNMEGQGAIQAQDRTEDNRFQVMEAVDCSNLGRIMGSWYTATPPLCRCYNGLSPADYFGRTMVANLPDSIRVGVINVSVAGCGIELFDKDNYQAYVATAPSWMIDIINSYGGNPYAHLVQIAKLAQRDGVIKGILLHQGESNVGDYAWPSKVKGVYDNLITDLGLDLTKVPLLAGEVVNADQGGACASVNSIIATLPQTIPNSYVISSKGCTDTTDNLHFNSAGYRRLGTRYGMKMLSLLGYDPNTYLEAECAFVGKKWEIKADTQASNGKYVTIKSGLNSTSAAPTDDSSSIYIPFTVYGDSTFYIFARLNCPTRNDDSYWVKMDYGEFVKCDSLTTSGWQWLKLGSYNLTNGDHDLLIAYCEDGAKLDKICISSYDYTPTGTGNVAINICNVDPTTSVLNSMETPDGYALEQNYPNPFNPATKIKFALPLRSLTKLSIYDLLGREVQILINKELEAGYHEINFDANSFPSGIYFYKIQSGDFIQTKKMVLMK